MTCQRSRACFVAILTLAGVARAHGLSAGVAEVQLRGDTAFVVIAARAGLFLGALDRDRDGLISGEEVLAQRASLQEQFERSFRLRGSGVDAPRVTFFDVGVPMNPLPAAPAYVRFTAQLQWAEVPDQLVVESEWGPLSLEVVRVETAAPGEWKAVAPAETVLIRGDGTPTPPLVRVEGLGRAPRSSPWALSFAVLIAGVVFFISVRRRSVTALEGLADARVDGGVVRHSCGLSRAEQ